MFPGFVTGGVEGGVGGRIIDTKIHQNGNINSEHQDNS